MIFPLNKPIGLYPLQYSMEPVCSQPVGMIQKWEATVVQWDHSPANRRTILTSSRTAQTAQLLLI